MIIPNKELFQKLLWDVKAIHPTAVSVVINYDACDDTADSVCIARQIFTTSEPEMRREIGMNRTQELEQAADAGIFVDLHTTIREFALVFLDSVEPGWMADEGSAGYININVPKAYLIHEHRIRETVLTPVGTIEWTME